MLYLGMVDVLPFFKSHYSIGRSILTLGEPELVKDNGPDSIVKIAKDHGLKEVCLIEDSMGGFMEAYVNLLNEKIKLIFGLRLTVCNDMNDKSEESLSTISKIIILCKNKDGYNSLIKISSIAAKDGFYYVPRIDYKTLKEFWNDNLVLIVPFYDSFIHKNLTTYSICVPDFPTESVCFSIEDNKLPFDNLIKQGVDDYVKQNDSHSKIKTKSIYYKNRKDFKSYLTFRCINNRTTLNKPNLDHMCSDNFSFESWEEQNGHKK